LFLSVEIVYWFEIVHHRLCRVFVHDAYRHCNINTHAVHYSVDTWWSTEQVSPLYDAEQA
jgi:hypothetical protein